MEEKRYTVTVTYPNYICEEDSSLYEQLLIVDESQMKLLSYLNEIDFLDIGTYKKPNFVNLAD